MVEFKKETKKNDRTILRDLMYGTKKSNKYLQRRLVLCDVRIFYDFMKNEKIAFESQY